MQKKFMVIGITIHCLNIKTCERKALLFAVFMANFVNYQPTIWQAAAAKNVLYKEEKKSMA